CKFCWQKGSSHWRGHGDWTCYSG
ncbi:unnamed protein product, partial [Allacma fusca]